MSTNGNGGLPGHFTSQHFEGAATLYAEPRPMAKTFSQEEHNVTFFPIKIHTRHRDGLKNRRKVTKKNQLGQG